MHQEHKTYILIPADESVPASTLTVHARPGDCGESELRALQEAVGGYIEVLPARVGSTLLANLVVNEEGLLRRLRPNPRASALRRHVAATPIVGDAVLVGLIDEEGEMLGLTPEKVDLVLRFLGEGGAS